MTRFIKRGGKVWIRMFPDKPITKKPAETRMGKGKGAPEEWVAVIKPGKILFEMEGVPLDIATEAMRLAAMKLAIPTKLVTPRIRGNVSDEPNKFREVDTAELAGQARETEEQLFRLRFQIGMGQTDGVKRYRELRKDRARMLGVLREREIDPAKAQAAAKLLRPPRNRAEKKKGK